MSHPLLAPRGTPRVMGVLNVTPDSFSDGGRWLDPAAAVAHGRSLAQAGADILDVGGESTRPGSVRPTLEEELERTLPVVEQLAADGEDDEEDAPVRDGDFYIDGADCVIRVEDTLFRVSGALLSPRWLPLPPAARCPTLHQD